MDQPSIEISVVIPAYQAESAVGQTIETLVPFLRRETSRAEILVVDDGSRDRTGEVAQRSAEAAGLTQDEGSVSFRLLRNEANRGKGHAIQKGMLQARGDVCIFTDADLAFGTEGLKDVLSALRAGAPQRWRAGWSPVPRFSCPRARWACCSVDTSPAAA